MIPRRRFLKGVAALGVSAGAAVSIHASSSMKRVAVLHPVLDEPNDRDGFARLFEPFGFRVGENLEVLWFEFPVRSNWDAVVPPLVARMRATKPDCITFPGEIWLRFVLDGAPGIPVVMYVEESDPVVLGVAKSLAQPGGNVTGIHFGASEVHLKRMEVMRRFVPATSCIAWIAFGRQLVWFPTFEAAAGRLGMRVRKIVPPISPADPSLHAFLREELARLRRDRCGTAHLYSGIPRFTEAVSKVALEHRIAISYAGGTQDAIAQEGVLFEYRARFRTPLANNSRAAAIIARVLRGERPGDIPFEGPAGYELRINSRTAARIGVAIPPDVRILANEVLR